MNATMGVGDFIPWEGGCALIGRATNVTPMHAHYAIQIGVGADFGIRFRPEEQSEWTAYHAAIIPSRQPHMMDATHVGGNVIVFIEPETPAGRVLSEQYVAGGISPIESEAFLQASAALFATWRRHAGGAETVNALQHAIDVLTQHTRPALVSDERILRAVAYIKSHLEGALTLDEVAAEACLSPSRFRHLFVEQTGTALRPYILWRRFLRAWELVVRGDSMSTAAHAAGFADAAHFTRTSHRMFGFPPTALQVQARPLRGGR